MPSSSSATPASWVGDLAPVPLGLLGPWGLRDLLVPADVSAEAVAAAYAEAVGYAGRLILTTSLGRPLPDGPIGGRVRPGSILVAHPESGADGPAPRSPVPVPPAEPTPARGASSLAAAVGCLLVAAAVAPRLDPGLRDLVVVLLVVAGVVGLVPRARSAGRAAGRRAGTVPALGAGAAYAATWTPGTDARPGLWSAVALAAAAAAGFGALRDALRGPPVEDEGGGVLGTWVVLGCGLGVPLAGAAEGGVPDRVVWSLLLLGMLLAAHLAPRFVVRVPDTMLLDVAYADPGRPGAPASAPPVDLVLVRRLADRGRRRLVAVVATIAFVATGSAALALEPAPGAREAVATALLVLLVGVGLLLVARIHAGATVRTWLRVGGLGCLLVLAHDVVPGLWADGAALLGVAAALAAALSVVASVATARGWRSVVASRAVEVGEVACLVLAIPAAVVAVGTVRLVWLAVTG